MILGPHRCKGNQPVMNRQLSTSISRKRPPENARGEGTTTRTCACRIRDAVRLMTAFRVHHQNLLEHDTVVGNVIITGQN